MIGVPEDAINAHTGGGGGGAAEDEDEPAAKKAKVDTPLTAPVLPAPPPLLASAYGGVPPMVPPGPMGYPAPPAPPYGYPGVPPMMPHPG